ncbi:MFS transporter [Saccharothrix sp. Mg75]|uniref:MFS transporter n=1 Tax=Saccharothrix sp. Mg75 TaxID=3445357 RepID=UPI003EE8BD46
MALITDIGTTPRAGAVLAAFAGYGALWGPYLALLPEIKRVTGAGDADLGAALLVGALAAMPAMAAVGRLLDRFGRPVAVTSAALFALTACLPFLAWSVPALVAGVALFGVGSGACNVVVLALAANAEARSGARVMNRAHALFCVGLLVGGTVAGVARAAGASAPVVGVVPALAAAVAVVVARGLVPEHLARGGPRRRARVRPDRAVLVLCALAGVAMLVESGVQQWSAVYLAEVLGAPVTLSAAAPGVFAGAMAVGRLSGHRLSSRFGDRALLVASGALSGVGVLLLALARTPELGLAATALVGVAVSVAAPTAYGLVGRGASDEDRGAALGSAASLAGVGPLLGPAAVGGLAGHADLRVAVGALLVGSVLICLLALRATTRAPATAPAGARR